MTWYDGITVLVILLFILVIIIFLLPFALWWALTVLGWLSMPFTFDVWLALLILITMFAGKPKIKSS